jgi:outer membrane lipoprotein LolB
MICFPAPRFLTRALALSASLLLAACVTQPLVLDDPDWLRHQSAIASLRNWELSGRLNVRQNDQSDTVNINWLQKDAAFDLRLNSSVLGLGAVHAYGLPTQVTVEKAGEEPVTLPGLGAVTQEYFGYDLPAEHLLYWVRGLPAPGLSGSNTFDANYMLATLRQVDASGLAWNLGFDRYMELEGSSGMIYLPGRITAQRAGLELIFLISAWEVPQGNSP